MNKQKVLLITSLSLFLLAIAQWDNIATVLPKKKTNLAQLIEKEEKEQQGKMKPAEWEHLSHGGLMGFPWKERQAATLQRLQALQQAGAQDRSGVYGPFNASWTERGPAGIPGRVTAAEVLYAQDRIYLLTDGGYIFKGSLAGNDWVCLNDHHPVGRGVDARLEVVPLPNGQNRLLAAGWDAATLSPTFLKYSDDEGATWQIPQGLPNGAWYRRTLAKPNGQVWHMYRSDASGTPKMVIYYSSDYGTAFQLLHQEPLQEGWHDNRCDMWLPSDSDTVFAVFNGKTMQISANGNAVALGQLPQVTNPEWAILTGGKAPDASDYTLYCRVWDGAVNRIFKSEDHGQQWSDWGQLVEGGLLWPFSNYAFVTDPSDPSKVYSGGWILGIKAEGQDWHYPHDLGGWVGYHGDVPEINFTYNPNTGEQQLFIGTDGGFYRYQPDQDQFESLSLTGLNNTQIYKMVSSQTDEYRMYIGTQDNGFNFNNTATAADETAQFNYLWGGDVTQVVSGNGGNTFWCFWIGGGGNFVHQPNNMQTTAVSITSGLDDSGYWETPGKADPNAPLECLVAGHQGKHLLRLIASPFIAPQAVEPLTTLFGSYDFVAETGARIGAIGISPLNSNHIYVMTENGVFLWSLDRGITWTKNNTAKDKIWPRYIAVSPTNPGEVVIGGAAYGNNTPCWRTTNHGQTLTPAEPVSTSVLSDNRVNALCYDPEGKYVFAAADIGAFVYVVADKKWHLINGAPAPLTGFHDVEFLTNFNKVRFATYARGVWDFHIEGLVSGTQDLGTKTPWAASPNPFTDHFMLQTTNKQPFDGQVMVLDAQGKTVYQSNISGQSSIRIPGHNWPKGVYTYVMIEKQGQRHSGKIVRK